MDTVAFLLMVSDRSRQPGLSTASWQAPARFVSGAVTGSCPRGGGGESPHASTHPCPALPRSWVALAAGRAGRAGKHTAVHATAVRHCGHVGHLAHGAKPSSWCKRCLAAFPLLRVLAL